MPNTPRVDFKFENNNVQSSVPLLGVSHVVARTTKGPVNDPSTIISSFSQFQSMFGEEIVPDGSISNIQVALNKGSKVRVSRVINKGAGYGWAGSDAGAKEEPSEANLTLTFSDPNKDTTQEEDKVYNLVIRSKNKGEAIVDVKSGEFILDFSSYTSATTQVSLTQKTKDGVVLNKQTMITFFAGDEKTKPNVSIDTFQNFINNLPNIVLLPLKTSGYVSLDQMVSEMRKYSNWVLTVNVGGTPLKDNNVELVMYQGDLGAGSDVEGWKEAFDALQDYNEAYQTILSHIHQHLAKDEDDGIKGGIPSDAIAVYSYAADFMVNKFESVLYVEIPKNVTQDSTDAPEVALVNALKEVVPTIGYGKNIAYFGGGIKYYDNYGTLQNCDVLGTVIGLGDTSASKNGPWYSFSGMNRGVVADALGPVMPNLGAPSKIDALQAIAEWYMNLFVIKDTSNQGKRTMLWHGFTSNPVNDSEKFLTITRLNLYLKKNIRPIVESYIEEPNTWDTWESIYYRVKPILDNLVANKAMASYEWLGDQFATSYNDLQVNTEAEVRQGKYKAKLKYTDIVTMQEITINVIINSASQEVSISEE